MFSLQMGSRDGCSGKKYEFPEENLARHFSMKPEAGFTYLGLLILLAIMGIVSAVAVQVGVVMHRRAAEEALLNVGSEFSRALESYRRATPAGQPDEPSTLQDLLRDPRFPGVVRHLRKLYYDPITGQQDWGIQREEESKQIVGVFSLSDAKPIKIANFDLRFKDFAGKSSYQEWVFTSTQADAGSSRGSTFISPLELMGEPQANPATNPSTDSSNQLPPGRTSPLELMN
ncbi:MAG: type II secretion system protein [Gallionellaceae bacterium]